MELEYELQLEENQFSFENRWKWSPYVSDSACVATWFILIVQTPF